MFKRANKITALLVAAASVMSVVPAMASDRLGTKDGTIESAVAFKDGKYVYQGYRSDSDDEGVYYNAGDKDKLLEDVNNAGLDASNARAVYGNKYAFANDGSDQYLVDLTSGDVIDDQTPEDDTDTVATKLKSALKKTERYGDLITVDAHLNLGYDATDDSAVITGVIPGAKFGDDKWYAYNVTPTSTQADTLADVVGTDLYGFTNQSAKYIDASNVANIYAYSTKKGKTVKIEEFSNQPGDVDSDTGLLATLKAITPLTQDKDYIYALATVDISDNDAAATLTEVATPGAPVLGAGTTTTHYFIQKISKAQGDKKDDAYLPKTVQSYELLTTTNKLDSDDSKDAYNAITSVNAAGKVKYSVANGVLFAIDNDGTNVSVTSINLKKDKVKYTINNITGLGDGNKVDVYLAEKDDDDNVDIKNADAVDVDVDGNVWAIGSGKVYEFKNNKFTQVYSADSSLNSISVYDENNMITWEADGDIYTTVNEGKAQTETEAAPVAPAKVGWDQLADGTWNFYDATGTKVVNNWVNVGGAWYYLKADGVMATGWQNLNGTWYFLKASGAMATGWLNDNGTWYFLNASGAMLANTTVDGYVLGASGAWVK